MALYTTFGSPEKKNHRHYNFYWSAHYPTMTSHMRRSNLISARNRQEPEPDPNIDTTSVTYPPPLLELADAVAAAFPHFVATVWELLPSACTGTNSRAPRTIIKWCVQYPLELCYNITRKQFFKYTIAKAVPFARYQLYDSDPVLNQRGPELMDPKP